jgi:hypothetical protein
MGLSGVCEMYKGITFSNFDKQHPARVQDSERSAALKESSREEAAGKQAFIARQTWTQKICLWLNLSS